MALPFYGFISKNPAIAPFKQVQTYKVKTYLDESFMSRGRWDTINQEEWLLSLVAGLCMTPLILVDIAKCRTHCPVGTDDYEYFNNLLEKGYEYITCDGWNRNTTSYLWSQNKVLLKKGIYEQDQNYKLEITKNSYKSDLDETQNAMIDAMMIPVTFIEKATRADLGKIFVSVNKLVTQNAQELRQALKSDIAELIRDLATELQPFFMATGDGSKKTGIMTELDCNRRTHDEFILDCVMFVHQKFAKNWTKDSRDFYYDLKESGLKTSFIFAQSILRTMLKSGATIKTVTTEVDGIKTKIKKATRNRKFNFKDLRSLFLNFMLRVDIESHNSKIVNDEKFDDFVQERHLAMLQDETIKMTQYESDGKTVRKIFTYKSASRRTPDQLIWSRGLYLEALSETDDLIIGVDPQRLFTSNQKYKLWKMQGGEVGKSDAVCPITKKNIPLSELYETHLWQADHIIPYDKGGKTTIENGQLICAGANRAKSNKVEMYSLEKVA